MQRLHTNKRLTESCAAAVIVLAFAAVAAAEKPCQLVKMKVSPENQRVTEGEAVSMNAPQGALTYLWQQTSGPSVSFDLTADHVRFSAPQVPPAGVTLTFLLTATGCDPVQEFTATATVTVTNVNQPPSASIAVSPTPAFEGDVVTLNASGSTDPDGDALTYLWTQIGGPTVTIDKPDAAIASFTAPAVGAEGVSLTFALTVKDGTLPDSENVIVIVQNLNLPPEVSAVCPANVDEVDTVKLVANATDDGEVVAYVWTHTNGGPSITPSDWSSASLVFTAPALELGQDGLLAFHVVVTDNEGLEAGATCSVQIHDVTKPVLTLPEDMTLEATSSAGAVVSFEASANDAHDGTVDVTCAPLSGTTFPLGATTVQCSAKDAADNEQTGSFVITVRDTTPPALTLPSDLTVEATGPSGAVAEFAATAEDLVDGAVDVNCDHSSGDTFPLGKTTVTCTADDAAHNQATGSFVVTVQDTTPPTVTVPADITEEATGPSGAAASFVATASDLVTENVTVTCAPSSGSTFPLGTTEVTCSATDEVGNTGTASFNVKVQDTIAPALTLPSNMTREATGPSGAVVTFTTSAVDLVSGNREVTCTPASNSMFALGTTTVNCHATDAAGNTATGSFTVAVVDTTPPTLTLPANMELVASGPSGAIAAFTASASDLVSGNVPVTCAPTSGSTFPLGATAVSCSAKDAAGNPATGSFTIRVLFASAGLCLAGPGHQVLQPIAPTGGSVFRKTGSTVPVKFRVCDAAGNAYHETNPVTSFQFIGVVNGTAAVEPNTDVQSTSADTLFRWSEADQFWIFNLSTKSYSAGLTYIFRISLIDGSTIDFGFGVK